MATQYTSLLGLALPVTGELSGSWGDVVNDSITSLLDTAVAGTTTLSTDGDVTLSTTTGASNQARQSILLCSGARTALRTITAPAQSKIYTVINATTGGYSVKVVGSGPTTGVTIVAGESAVIAWNGSDFIKVSNTGGSASFTNVTVSGTTTLSGLTASTALALNSSKEVVSVTNTGTGNNVLSASPTLTGTISGANASLSGTLAVTGVATLTAQPILSSLTASQAVFTDGSKGLVSNAITGTGNVVMSASPTLTGTVAGASLQLSSLTSGRVTYAGASGLLQDSANLTFNGTDLTVSGAVNAGTINATTLDLTNLEVTNIKAKDGTAGMQIADSTGVVSFTANPVMSGGTANGVAYLNGSKVLTTGSALTFDGTDVGIGGAPVTGLPLRLLRTSSGAQIRYQNTAATWDSGVTAAGAYEIFSAANTSIQFGVNSSEQMRLTSTGLGIGTSSPAYKLDVNGGAQVASGSAGGGLNYNYGASASSRQWRLWNDVLANGDFAISQSTTKTGTTFDAKLYFDASGNLGIGTSSPASLTKLTVFQDSTFAVQLMNSSQNYTLRVDAGASDALILGNRTSFTDLLAISTSGNLGLGVTPSAWNAGKAIEVGTVGNSIWGVGAGEVVFGQGAYYNSGYKYANSSYAASTYEQYRGTHVWKTAPSGTAGNAISFTQAMTLTAAGDLGIGTSSPREKLDVAGNIAAPFSDNSTIQFQYLTGSSYGLGMMADATNRGLKLFTRSADGVGYISFSTGGMTERMRLDYSGNLGLGVTPSAWWSSIKPLQMSGNGFIGSASNYTYVGANFFYNSSANPVYVASAAASLYEQGAGGHRWFTAPSGTAGNAISFTQAMTLDASGNWMAGTTTAIGRATVVGGSSQVAFHDGNGGASNYGLLNYGGSSGELTLNANSSGGNTLIRFLTSNGGSNAERARIDSSGSWLVGTTSDSPSSGTGFKVIANLGAIGHFDPSVVTPSNNTAQSCWDIYSTAASGYRFYVTTSGVVNAVSTTITAISDQRLKENIRDLDDGLDIVMALKPRKFDWKDGKGADTKNARGFIAQEFETVLPDLIDEWKDPAPKGEEPYKAVRADLIPVLVKAIQEQQAIIESLKARLDAANL